MREITQVSPEIFIAGCGPGSRDYVTPRVTALAHQAQLLAGAPRLLELFPDAKARRMPQNGATEPWLDRLEATPARPCVVLVAGDAGEEELTQRVVARFGQERCRIEPGIGTVQLACALLGLVASHVAQFDLRSAVPDGLAMDVATKATCLFLMGAVGAEALVAEATEGQRHAQISVIEDLSLVTQSVAQVTVAELRAMPATMRRIVVVS